MKKYLSGLMAACILLALGTPCFAETQAAVTVKAPSAILMTEDGRVLFEKDAHSKREPASVTKIMTLLLVCEAIDSGALKLTDQVTASANAAGMGGSQIWLKEGEVFSVEELIKCVTVVSANDCALDLAEHLTGSEEAFVQRMNQRAQELGMMDTNFVNCCGLTAQGHVTSAYDIGLMSAQLMRNHRWIQKYTLIWQDSIRGGASVLTNTNRLVKSYQGITGLKTGFTSTAGYCMSATAERGGLPLIAVIMGGETRDTRNADAAALLNYGFASYAAVQMTADQPLMPVPVKLGLRTQVGCTLQECAPLVIEKSALSGLSKTVEIAEQLTAPVEKGQQIGTLTVRSGDAVLQQTPIVADEGVARMSLWEIFCQVLRCVTMKTM